MSVSPTGLGYPDGAVGGADHWSAVAHNHELGLFCLAGDQSCKAFNIHPIKETVHFIEGIEGRGAEALKSKQKAERRKRFFSTRHSRKASHCFAFGMCYQGEAAFEGVVRVVELQVAIALREAGEDVTEMTINCFKSFHEGFLTKGGDGLDAEQEFFSLLGENLKPFDQIPESLFELFEFFKGQHVHWFQGFHTALKLLQIGLKGLKSCAAKLCGDLRGRVWQGLLEFFESEAAAAKLFGKGLAILSEAFQVPLGLL